MNKINKDKEVVSNSNGEAVAATREQVVRANVVRLYIDHWTELQIAEHLNISLEDVSLALSEAASSWSKLKLSNREQLLALELAKLDSLEFEYAKAWKASQPRSDVIENGELVVAYLPGNIEFLRGISDCISKRCSLLGLDVKKVSLENAAGGGLSSLLGMDN